MLESTYTLCTVTSSAEKQNSEWERAAEPHLQILFYSGFWILTSAFPSSCLNLKTNIHRAGRMRERAYAYEINARFRVGANVLKRDAAGRFEFDLGRKLTRDIDLTRSLFRA